MQKITPMLWFDNQAEEAVKFYTQIFSNAPHARQTDIGEVSHYDEAGSEASGQPKGSAMVVPFELEGQKFLALNGGPMFTFSEAISLVIDCEDQEEVDYFWAKLTEGGEESQCGWLKDKYGLSWQVVPKKLTELLADPDQKKSGNVMQAMLKMKKIDVHTLEEAYNQQ